MPWKLILSPTIELSPICNGSLISITSQTSSWRSFNPVFTIAFTWMSHRTLYLICPNLHHPTKPAAPPKSWVKNHSPLSPPHHHVQILFFSLPKRIHPPFVSLLAPIQSLPSRNTSFWKANLIMSVSCQKTAPLSWVIKRNEKYKI